jgi:phospholipid/cholesterol/gamma-HCH transport system ATP-binding protein
MTNPLIQFDGVFKSFGDNIVLKGVDLSIYQGQVTTIIGKSGIGKSVLLKHIIGLLEPDAGEILFRGQALTAMTSAERKAVKMKFSYMFQGTALFDSMTVYDNVALPLKEKNRVPFQKIERRVRDKLAQLDLVGIEKKYPSQLSGGMKKRVAMARALVTDPEIVLFDEPTTSLDPIRKNAAHTMISEYQRTFGFTGVMVSHDIPDVFYISQRIALLDNGKILFQGSPKEIRNSADPVIRQFIRGQDPETVTVRTAAKLNDFQE